MDLVMRKDGMPEDPRLPVFFQPDKPDDANNFTTPLWWTGRSTPVMTE